MWEQMRCKDFFQWHSEKNIFRVWLLSTMGWIVGSVVP